MRNAVINPEGSGFASVAELDEWLAFCEWERDPDADLSLYEWEPDRGWFPAARALAAALLPFIAAVADLLVADLLRVSPGKG